MVAEVEVAAVVAVVEVVGLVTLVPMSALVALVAMVLTCWGGSSGGSRSIVVGFLVVVLVLVQSFAVVPVVLLRKLRARPGK